jgi:hypothetical protein
MHDTTILDVGVYPAKCGVGSVQQTIFKGEHVSKNWLKCTKS